MNKFVTISTTALAGFILSSAALADNIKDNKVARDARGNFVTSVVSGNCVRTAWEANNNENVCAPTKTYVTVVSSPARELKESDKVVFFDFDSSKLDSNDKRRLDNLASTFGKSSDIKDVKIVGYADKIGDKEYNVNLSQKRAKSVQNYLAAQGYVDTNLSETRGLGETSAYTNCEGNKATGRLIECLSSNRRVEVEVEFYDKRQAYYNKNAR